MGINWRLDEGYHLDAESAAELSMEMELSIDTSYGNAPFRDLEMVMNCILEIDVVHSVPIDLLPLIPEKFHSSEILKTYVDEVELRFGNVHSKILDLIKLVGPNTATSATYLRNLGALIGVTFPPEDEISLAEIRKILSQAVDWYKIKGSYQAIQVVSQIQSFSVNLYDMYTDDYVTFVLTDWFVGEEDENPPGLGAAYYKSPHFGMEVILNEVYTEGSMNYLWYRDYLDNLMPQVEEVRPVHTVPHYLLLLNPHTDEKGNVIEVDGEIKAKVTSNWVFGAKFFDAVSSSDKWDFDNGSMDFDTDETSYIKSITKWVLGTGNYPGVLDSTITDIQTPVLTGTIDADDITISDDKYSFEFIVPSAIVQYGISELSLSIPGVPDTLVLLSCFPKVDKVSGTELRIVIEIYKKDLSV